MYNNDLENRAAWSTFLFKYGIACLTFVIALINSISILSSALSSGDNIVLAVITISSSLLQIAAFIFLIRFHFKTIRGEDKATETKIARIFTRVASAIQWILIVVSTNVIVTLPATNAYSMSSFGFFIILLEVAMITLDIVGYLSKPRVKTSDTPKGKGKTTSSSFGKSTPKPNNSTDGAIEVEFHEKN